MKLSKGISMYAHESLCGIIKLFDQMADVSLE